MPVQNWNMVFFLVLSAVVAAMIGPAARQEDPATLLKDAEKAFEAHNYKDAAAAFEKLLAKAPRHEKAEQVSDRLVVCYLRLQLFDEAILASEARIARNKGTALEAPAERSAGNLLLAVPHWGTRSGGKFLRAKWGQGTRVQSERHDKKIALAHLERARELYASVEADATLLAALAEERRKDWREERLSALLDLAAAAAFVSDDDPWSGSTGGVERDDAAAVSAGDGDFEESHSKWQNDRKRPIGLRLDATGAPMFAEAPKEWSASHSDDPKVLFILAEVRALDTTSKKNLAAESWYRQAMLARERFGIDKLRETSWRWRDDATTPLDRELDGFKPWELADDGALAIAGGRLRIVTLPAAWDVIGLLRKLVSLCGDSKVVPSARYALGVYHQTRQQYPAALEIYAGVEKLHADTPWAGAASTQRAKIVAAEIQISDNSVKPPGRAPEIQITHRNVKHVWFTAREIDAEGFLDDLRNRKVDIDKGFHWFWGLGNWHGYFTSDRYERQDEILRTAMKYLGKEIVRWDSSVAMKPDHRPTETTVPASVSAAGAYLIQAWNEAPPASSKGLHGADALILGMARAVTVLTDLVFVEKPVPSGTLFYVCDALAGAPVKGATIDAIEIWSVYNQKKKRSEHFQALYRVETGADGLALLERPKHENLGQWHAVVKTKAQGGATRLAWTGMQHWNHWSPASATAGSTAYAFTDRPVYRPDQTVRYKAWLRERKDGAFEILRGSAAVVTVRDARGNDVYQGIHTIDAMGGIDGSYQLPREAALGVFQLQVAASGSYIGGASFRVEEYKKPEFEVTVTPGKTHAKLGEKVVATVKAAYYFGGPVVDATVSYKVFREEFRHQHFEPGAWDWLYGRGYGLAYYGYDWLPWWQSMRSCWSPPGWWWGCMGTTPPAPVRELVLEGEGRIGPGGTTEITIDSSAALRDHGDRDHRYVVEAEVRDASRRVIKGEGAVAVTRQAYFAHVGSELGYARPGEDFEITVRCLTPGDQPVKTEGVLLVAETDWGHGTQGDYRETEVERIKIATDDEGRATFKLRSEKSGQLRVRFEAPDAWGGKVEGNALVWICGSDFDGTVHRFNELELITDRRTYRPGEVAHVMINTKAPRSHVLFADDAADGTILSWRVVELKGRSTIIDVPVKAGHRPNFFVEATTVADYHAHTQTRQICVPPENGVMNITLAPDKPAYKPGEACQVAIAATDHDGLPVEGQFVLSAFDQSLLYIQGETTPPIASFFHGAKKAHSPGLTTNLFDRFATRGNLKRPFEWLDPMPAGWRGFGADVSDFRTVDFEDGYVVDGLSAHAKNDVLRERGRASRGELAGEASAPGGGGTYGRAGPPASAAAKGMLSDEAGNEKLGFTAHGDDAPPAEAKLRTNFADSAAWLASITTDATGRAIARFTWPENLTAWNLAVRGMTAKTRVGEARASAVTKKDFLVRLQAPRFFRERDEVVLSANVHNYLAKAKRAKVSIALGGDCLVLEGGSASEVDVEIAADGEARVDWRVKVLKEGVAKVSIKGLTDEESDAMELSFPVLVHGMMRQETTTASMRPDEIEKSIVLEFRVPEERRPELTRLELRFSPSLIGAMLDALPYCLDYPYGCTEQTMSRFLPAVLTLRTLQDVGIDLEDVKKIRGRMEEVRKMEKHRRSGSHAESPIFETEALKKIIAESLARIASMQRGDGGWGWWTTDDSNPYLTSYVLQALVLAAERDVAVKGDMIDRGMRWLKAYEDAELLRKEWTTSESRAFSAYVLSLRKLQAECQTESKDDRPSKLVERLWVARDKLNLYGKSLLAMTLANLDDKARATTALENILQYKEENPETQVAHFRTPSAGWWHWWNDDIETNAWALRAMMRIDPKNEAGPRIVKWLLNNRKNGYYWRSTRDTTLCVAAMAEFVRASGEGQPDYTLTLEVDGGAVTKEVKITKETFFTADNRMVLEGESIGAGVHQVRITKRGKGALYLNSYLSVFTKEESIPAAGHELKVDRSYFLLRQVPFEVEVEDKDGRKIKEKRLRFERVPLASGDAVVSGDQIQVEMKLGADNNYSFLALEDPKPAGCEPMEVKSGGSAQEGFYTYRELRDEKSVFFLTALDQGDHLIRYRLRAEIPGVFHTLPATLYAMYVPELRANAAEHLLTIKDR